MACPVGVHPTTAWRDLQRITGLVPQVNYRLDGELLFTVTRACQRGPVISITDPDGNEVRGPRRRAILRQVGRYASGRR